MFSFLCFKINRIYEIVAVGMDDFTEYWCEVDNGIGGAARMFSMWLNQSGLLFYHY